MNTASLLLASALSTSALAAEPVWTTERVTFPSAGETLVGTLYRPTSAEAGKPLAAIIVTGAWLTVKEQMPDRYARELAARGYAALAFDFRGWGESEGVRRQFEDPAAKVADIVAAAEYLSSRDGIDPRRLGGLGICASAGYMVTAATEQPKLASVAVVAPWLHDAAILEQTYGGAARVAELIVAADAENARYERTQVQNLVPAASRTDRRAIMFGVPYYTETDRGMIPAWRNEVDPGFWRAWLTFDALLAAPRLHQPFLMVHSEAAAIPVGAHRFFAAVPGVKQELWLEGVSQLDFYDRDVPVARAADALAEHFNRTLPAARDLTTRNAGAIRGVREFFAALEAGDIARFLRVWAENGVQEMPFAPGAFPRKLEGKAAIEKQYAPLPSAYTGMRFPIRRLAATETPGVVFVEYEGSIGLKSGGRYDNRYVGIFEFDAAGKLSWFCEYFDPFVLVQGFPGAAEATVSDEARIERAVQDLARAVDQREWAAVRGLFSDRVWVDYTSVAGGQAAEVAADSLIAGWRAGLGRYPSTKHHFGDVVVQVDGDRATATFTGQATHAHAGGERWSCGGDYSYVFSRTAEGWRVSSAQFTLRWEQGRR